MPYHLFDFAAQPTKMLCPFYKEVRWKYAVFASHTFGNYPWGAFWDF
jgi:hypothetical protein